MCDACGSVVFEPSEDHTVPVEEAIGMVLAHDITEIRPGEFKGRAFKKGHVIRPEDIEHLKRLGKDRLYVLRIGPDEMHEDEAAYELARALMGEGVEMQGPPKEGRINLIAARDGLLKVDTERLKAFNMLGEVMCATLHNNTLVRKGQVVAGTRAIPLVVKKAVVEEAVQRARSEESGVKSQESGGAPEKSEIFRGREVGSQRSEGVIEVRQLRRPRAGVVITGNEVYYGRIKDAFAPIIRQKIEAFGGEIVGLYFAPDDAGFIEARLRELIEAGADLLITTGGMSVDPDDVTRFAIRNLGVREMHYGSAVLPGAMFLIAYLKESEVRRGPRKIRDFSGLIPVLGIPACGMYHRTTVFDLVLPRILAGEYIDREALAEMGHGGLCLNCRECRYPVCPFGK